MNYFRCRVPALIGALGLLPALSLPAFSAEPSKIQSGSYADLWNKSPFTVPPAVVDEVKEEENPLEDYTLAGVCQMKGGWFVVLINKKNRDEPRVRIKPDSPNDEGFQIVSVKNGKDRLETKVEIKTRGGKTGWVEYDEKFIAVKQAAPAAPPRQQQGHVPPVPQRPGGSPPPVTRPPVPSGSPGANNGDNSNGRSSRVRRVPPPPR
jgi:hypothetical protein